VLYVNMNRILNQHSVVDSLLHCGFFKDFFVWGGDLLRDWGLL